MVFQGRLKGEPLCGALYGGDKANYSNAIQRNPNTQFALQVNLTSNCKVLRGFERFCGGGIGRRIAILSKKVVKYTVSTGEVDSSKTIRGANPRPQ